MWFENQNLKASFKKNPMTADFSACGDSPSTTIFCDMGASISHLVIMHSGKSKSSQPTDALTVLHFIQKRMVLVVHCKAYLIKSCFQTMDFWETLGKTKLQGAQLVALPLQWFFSLWGRKGKETAFHLHKLQVIHAVGFTSGKKPAWLCAMTFTAIAFLQIDVGGTITSKLYFFT